MIFEIQVLASEDDRYSPMILMDRCTLSAENTKDAAQKYAALFEGSARINTPEESE